MNAKSIVLALSLATLVTPSVMNADAIQVYVGYADNLRPSGFFPSVWLGGTNNGQAVVSQSSANQSFDTGAIRIDNTGSTTVVISDFEVSLNNGGYLYNIWGSGPDLTLNAGQTGIFTQTSAYNFDTSDDGLFGGFPPPNLDPNNADANGNTNLIGGCSSPSSFYTTSDATGACAANNAPVISFLENGTQQSFVDTGFVVDTGQWDFVNNSYYGEDGNESINWNTIGGTSRGGDTTPEPATWLLLGFGLTSCALFRKRVWNRR